MDAIQPQCPDDRVVMRDVDGGWSCPECGKLERAEDVAPPVFDGPSIRGG